MNNDYLKVGDEISHKGNRYKIIEKRRLGHHSYNFSVEQIWIEPECLQPILRWKKGCVPECWHFKDCPIHQKFVTEKMNEIKIYAGLQMLFNLDSCSSLSELKTTSDQK